MGGRRWLTQCKRCTSGVYFYYSFRREWHFKAVADFIAQRNWMQPGCKADLLLRCRLKIAPAYRTCLAPLVSNSGSGVHQVIFISIYEKLRIINMNMSVLQ